MSLTLSSLTEIANACGTDKGTVRGGAHGYTGVYEAFLNPYRQLPLKLLEIGLAIGGPELDVPATRKVTDAPSMRMWHEYFPNARLYGLDISDFSALQTDWFTFFQADCGNAEQLEAVASSGEIFDVVIDDGSHASFHQQLALCKLFRTLKSGGLYFIEDLNWVPATYQRTLRQVPRTEILLGAFVENGRFAGNDALPTSEWDAVGRDIASIFFFDEDSLKDYCRFFNTRNGVMAQMPSYVEIPRSERFKRRGYARRIMEQADAFTRAFRAQTTPPRTYRTKLAVIQKR